MTNLRYWRVTIKNEWDKLKLKKMHRLSRKQENKVIWRHWRKITLKKKWIYNSNDIVRNFSQFKTRLTKSIRKSSSTKTVKSTNSEFILSKLKRWRLRSLISKQKKNKPRVKLRSFPLTARPMIATKNWCNNRLSPRRAKKKSRT